MASGCDLWFDIYSCHEHTIFALDLSKFLRQVPEAGFDSCPFIFCGNKDSLVGVGRPQYDWKLFIVYLGAGPVDFWLHGGKPRISQDDLLFS